jgi:hypothetical protein
MEGVARSVESVDSRITPGEAPVMTTRQGMVHGSAFDGLTAPSPFHSFAGGNLIRYTRWLAALKR